MHLDFYTRAGNRDVFATCGPQNTTQKRKIAQGKFYPTAIFSVIFLRRAGITGRENWTRAYPDAACFSTAPSDHHRTNMDNNSNDDRRDGIKCTRQAGALAAGDGRMPGMPGFSSTITTPRTAPAGWLSDGVAPNPCPQPCRPFTLPGNKRVAVGAPDARWGGGNTWQPRHSSAIADAMGSGLGSVHVDGNILSDLRNLTYEHCCCCCCCRLHVVRVARYRRPPATHWRFVRRAVWQADPSS